MKKLLIFLLLLTSILGEKINGKVTWISDGDTLTLTSNNTKYRVRFYGIDAPETKQDFGNISKEFLIDLLLHQQILIDVVNTDKYGRKVAKVYLEDLYINEFLVKFGYAWWYEYFAKNEKKLKEAQEYAIKNELGLWTREKNIAPWVFRRKK